MSLPPIPPITHIICREAWEVDWREVGHHPDNFVAATFPC